MTAVLYADVSSFQGSINWSAYAAWSKIVAMKATEGVGFTDPDFAAYRSGAVAAGIRIIYYHYARADLGNNPEAEANYFHSVVGTIRPGDGLMLDYEQDSPALTSDWAYRWLTQALADFGIVPMIYASPSFIQGHLQEAHLAHFPLVLADWTFDPSTRPTSPWPWTNYAALQYTDRGTVPGISGAVDVNVYLDQGGASVNPNFQKEADLCWDSTAHLFLNNMSPVKGTGIYNAWVAAWLKGPQFGPPLTNEYDSPRADGSTVTCQEFAHARCEYEFHTGVAHWYGANGLITI